MYDINFKKINKKKIRIIIFFFVCLSIAFLIIGISIYTKVLKSNLDSKIMSSDYVIEEYKTKDGKIKYNAVYYYKIKNKEYTCKINSYFINNEYENKTVYYDSKNPSKCLTIDDLKNSNYVLILLIIPVIFIIISLKKISNIDKKIEKLNRLNEVGTLIKNIPYEIKESNGDNVILLIKYEMSKGNVLKFYSDAFSYSSLKNKEGVIDLVLDEAYPEVYYIDFNINRIEGNKEEDFYKVKEEEEIPTVQNR